MCRIVIEIGDEDAVDLHHVDREPLQVAERRVAGSEVVECEHHADLLEIAEREERAEADAE